MVASDAKLPRSLILLDPPHGSISLRLALTSISNSRTSRSPNPGEGISALTDKGFTALASTTRAPLYVIEAISLIIAPRRGTRVCNEKYASGSNVPIESSTESGLDALSLHRSSMEFRTTQQIREMRSMRGSIPEKYSYNIQGHGSPLRFEPFIV